VKIFDEHKCMTHSFYVLTNQVSYKQLMHRKDFTLMFNPTKKIVPMKDDTYDVLIKYFENEEDYKKCALLLKCKKEAVKNNESVLPLDQALYDE
tara:strand:- start:2507 stop:2788 length:282 start_codon:yes stop_codon:yes gene_type:complete